MSIWIYIKDSFLKIIHFIVTIIIINFILITSTPLSQSIFDIVYMNILVIGVSLAFFVYGYLKWKQRYYEFKRSIEAGNDIDLFVPQDENFESQLIRETLDTKNKEIYRITKELKFQLDEINDYITKWTHEIKIPISVCELILDRIAEDENLDLSNKISEDLRMELERIKFLINQVLYTSRASSYSEDLCIEEVNLEKVIRDVVRKNAAFFISKRINIKLNNLNHNVMTDKKWVAYIIGQMLNNAYKYVDYNGNIEISATEDEKTIRLDIRDDGIGILTQDLNRIFDKGFTGSNGRMISKSTGMGLYLAKKMADKLGHRIEVSSEVGHYTKFSIVFYKLSDYINVTKM